jgi:hypothetical protein
MNHKLTQQIVKHVFSNLKIIDSDFIKQDSLSIIDREFSLPETIGFEDDDNIIQNHLWACQFSVENKNLKILVCDASLEKDVKEFCVIIHLDDTPMYGLYLNVNDDQGTEALIACSVNAKEWVKCSTYLEATFLAAMEQLKNHIIFPAQCHEYKKEYNAIINFLEYYVQLGS